MNSENPYIIWHNMDEKLPHELEILKRSKAEILEMKTAICQMRKIVKA